MARRKTIYVDEMKLLANICRITTSDLALLKREADRLEAEYDADVKLYWLWQEACNLRKWREIIKADGIEYDLVEFAGRDLTPSERIRHQEAVRRLEAHGLVQLYGTRASRVRVTRKGWKAANEITNKCDSSLANGGTVACARQRLWDQARRTPWKDPMPEQLTEPLLERCRNLAAAVAPELRELNILDAGAIENLAPRCGCLGWAIQHADYNIKAQLGERYKAAPTIVIDCKSINEQAQPGKFECCTLQVMVHELAHVVPIKHFAELKPTPQFLEFQKQELVKGLTAPSPRPGGADDFHGPAFIRRALHLWIRAAVVNIDMPLDGLLTWYSRAENYLPILLGEAINMRDKTFAEIESTEPPAMFLEQWQADLHFEALISQRRNDDRCTCEN